MFFNDTANTEIYTLSLHDALPISQGQVVGVNTAVIQPAQGICFAMPINTAKRIIGPLMQMGRVRRARIGIAGQTVPLPQRLVREYDLTVDTGVLVTGLETGSPAQAATLRERDIIVTFNGEPVCAVDDLHRLLTADYIGVRSLLTLLRRGQRLELTIVPSESSFE